MCIEEGVPLYMCGGVTDIFAYQGSCGITKTYSSFVQARALLCPGRWNPFA